MQEGDFVIFDNGTYAELGCIKSFDRNNSKIWPRVVYHCEGDWNNHRRYTSELTDPVHLQVVGRIMFIITAKVPPPGYIFSVAETYNAQVLLKRLHETAKSRRHRDLHRWHFS